MVRQLVAGQIACRKMSHCKNKVFPIAINNAKEDGAAQNLAEAVV